MSRWPPSSPPMAPHTPRSTDTENGERSHSANLYNRSKFAIFNDHSQLEFYYYSLILISLGAAGLVFPLIHHQNWGDCIVFPLSFSPVSPVMSVRTGLSVPRSLYVWTVTTLIVQTHARFWSISPSLLSQLFIALQSEKHLIRERERERERNWRDKGWSGGARLLTRTETKH